MEFVSFYRVASLAEFCSQLRRHYFLLMGTSLSGTPVSPGAMEPSALFRPPAVILGNEEKGIAPSVASSCDQLIKIPGAGTVESLNVAAAAAILSLPEHSIPW